jgi:hypothetical protein
VDREEAKWNSLQHFGYSPLAAEYFTSKTKIRKPDFDPALTPGKIIEVKDRAKVFLDPAENLPDFIEYARRNSLQVELWVRKDAWIQPELRELTKGDNPLVVLKYLYEP